jgi:hypothetical protein
MVEGVDANNLSKVNHVPGYVQHNVVVKVLVLL